MPQKTQEKAASTARVPLFGCAVQAGFPSPADDYLEQRLDLNEKLIANPPATFVLKATGDSMSGAGINPGGWLIVDRSLTPRHGKVVIAVLDGMLTVKRLYRRGGVVRLLSDNPDYPPIELAEAQDLQIWGVVTYVVNPL